MLQGFTYNRSEGIEILERLSKETKSVDILPRYQNLDLKKISEILIKIKSTNRKKESILIAKKHYSLEKAVSKYLKLCELYMKIKFLFQKFHYSFSKNLVFYKIY